VIKIRLLVVTQVNVKLQITAIVALASLASLNRRLMPIFAVVRLMVASP
jgi:hypothetical protein